MSVGRGLRMPSCAAYLSIVCFFAHVFTSVAASPKPSPGFQIIWKDQHGRIIEFRGEGTQTYAKVTLQARGFRTATNARSATDHAVTQVIEQFQRLPQYRGKQVRERNGSRRDVMQGPTFVRKTELIIGNANAPRNPKKTPAARPTTPQLPPRIAPFKEAKPPSTYSPQLGRAAPSVVRIVKLGRLDSKGSPSYGSGWFVSQNGHLVTNCHVYDGSGGGKTAVVAVGDNRSYRITGSVLADRKRDIVVLKVDAQNTPYLRLAMKPPPVGTEVYALGRPLGYATVRAGPFRGGAKAPNYSGIYFHARLNVTGGWSGGPLLNREGQAIGCLRAANTGFGFAIPLDDLRSFLDRAAAKNQVTPVGHEITAAEEAKLIARAERLVRQAKILAMCDDRFSMYVNGEKIMEPSGHVGQTDHPLEPGDVITVKAQNLSGPRGFGCYIIFREMTQLATKVNGRWRSYRPANPERWYDPNGINGLAGVIRGDTPAEMNPTNFRFRVKPEMIWGEGQTCYLTWRVPRL
jgi:S1-C subfamily serine protease